MFKFVLLLIPFLLVGCYDPDTATAVLSDSGYTDVHTFGYSFNACPENYVYSTAFTAYTPSGKLVKGAVCSNIFFTINQVLDKDQ